MDAIIKVQADMGFCNGQIFNRWYLVVLLILAACIFSCRIQIGWYAGKLAYCICIHIGWRSQHFRWMAPMWFVKKKGWSIVKARKISMLIYAFFPLLVIVSQAAGSYNMWYAIIIIGIAASAHQAWSANLFTTVSDMFPKTLVASVVGIGGMVGGLGGMA